jgi:hypothetical protein
MSTAARLSEFLDAWPAKPFDWASGNCCHFAAAWVKAATGREIELPKTPDVRAARRVLKTGLADACRRLYGGPEVLPTLAQTGDLVLVPVEGEGVGEALGICSGRDVILLGADGKPAVLPIDRATTAWRLA